MGLVVNGWNNVVENNSGKTFGAQVSVKPTGALSIVQNYMAGPEQPDDNDDWRQLSDTIVTFTVDPGAQPDGQLRLRPRHVRRCRRTLAGDCRLRQVPGDQGRRDRPHDSSGTTTMPGSRRGRRRP